jgi:hypothetical protein
MLNFENVASLNVTVIDGIKLNVISYKVSINLNNISETNITNILLKSIESVNNKVIVNPVLIEQQSIDICRIRTPSVILQVLYKDIIQLSNTDIREELSSLIKSEISKTIIGAETEVILVDSVDIYPGINQSKVSYFNYNKNSHIVTGQTGIATLIHDNSYSASCNDCQKGIETFYGITKLIDNAIFVNRSDVVSQNDEFIEISYSNYYVKYTISMNNIIILDVEPTLQNITEWIFNKGGYEFYNGHVKALQLSQGFNISYTKQVRF